MFHTDELAASGRVGFVVVDEAHHIGQGQGRPARGLHPARPGADPARRPRGARGDRHGNNAVADDIDAVLPIQDSVIDETARDNLYLDDQRNIPHRDDYLASLVATGEKTVIYVNSREHSVALARMLRRRVPQLACMIGFYNAGLSATSASASRSCSVATT